MKAPLPPRIQTILALLLLFLLWALSYYLESPRPKNVSALAPRAKDVSTQEKGLTESRNQITLPAEVSSTLKLIEKGGPFPYEKDGSIFGNHERKLPAKARGYYKEYTVPTPGVFHRGARRLVRGGEGEVFYTDDHYRTFTRIVPP